MPSPETEGTRLAHLGNWTWDLAEGVTWSPECFHAFGADPHDFMPTFAEVLRRVVPGDRERVEALLDETVAAGATCTLECRILAPGAEERWIRAVCVTNTGAGGTAIGMHGTVQDITGFNIGAFLARDRRARDPYLYEPKTGLANWRLFRDRAAVALARSERDSVPFALLVVDVNQFRLVNERFGHNVGDLVLIEVASRLDAAFRPYDTVSRAENAGTRLGGDEFVILCEHVPDRPAAEGLAGRVQRVLEQTIDVTGGSTQLTAAVGVVLAPVQNADLEGLIDLGCAAMRQAKAAGNDATQTVFAEDLTEDQRTPGEDARALKVALDSGAFVLHYQPQVTLVSDRIAGAEALLRWEHPTLGLVAPAAFIPLAEESGLIVPIGAWVIQEACRECARWRRIFPDRPPLVVSVNVSARQFGPDLVRVVDRALEDAELEPSGLRLEVTESLLMADVESAITVSEDLARLGVTFSVDDFGTGYSSLAYLKRFALHELKIDKSFVDGIDEDADDTAIVSAIIALAHALGLVVVAEGVESEAQVRRLRTLGCELAQGYHFARPGSADAMDALLQAEAELSWVSHRAEPSVLASRDGSYRAERVLLVDDAADVRLLARMSLNAVGFEAHEAVDAATALTAAQEMRPDCVLLDLSLPDVNGLEVCRILRSDPTTADCTIVVLTSEAGSAEKVAAFSAGADDYIVKPFSPRELAGRVQSAMRRRREHARPAATESR